MRGQCDARTDQPMLAVGLDEVLDPPKIAAQQLGELGLLVAAQERRRRRVARRCDGNEPELINELAEALTVLLDGSRTGTSCSHTCATRAHQFRTRK